MAMLVFGLMMGALLCGFVAGATLLLARDRVRSGRGSVAEYEADRAVALVWVLRGAGCLVVLAAGGLWRVAEWVTR